MPVCRIPFLSSDMDIINVWMCCGKCKIANLLTVSLPHSKQKTRLKFCFSFISHLTLMAKAHV